MGTIIFNVESRAGYLEGMARGKYVQGIYSAIVFTFCGPGTICKETWRRATVLN